MSFTTPVALILLLALPFFFWLGRPLATRSRRRVWISTALRLIVVALVVLALAGAQAVRAADELAVVFLVDASDSVAPEQLAEAETYVAEALENMEVNDRAAVVVFGSNALVDRPMSGLSDVAAISSVPQALNTDLAEAIRLGLALFPAGSGRRLVILSDGAATIGDTDRAAALARASGVEISYVPLSRPAGATEALITGVDAPTRVIEGDPFTVVVRVESTAAMNATLRVLAGGTVVAEQTAELVVGSNNIPIRLRASEQEFLRYTVELVPAADTYYQNNRLATFTEVVGAPRVLVVAPDGTVDDRGNPVPDEAPQLITALRATGLTVDRITPAELPASLAQLSNYASVVLVNVNAKSLTPRKMETLQSYVRDLGGGLVAVGGPDSYGMGGYFRTPLEEALPVEMQIKDQDRFPSVSIAIVIDRSGSMGAQEGGFTKIQLAAEGAVRVVELLNDFDEITVIPVDTQPSGQVGPASASERDAVIQEIRGIGAGGGGIYVRTGLQAAANALAGSDNEVQHIILLADGADSEEQEGVPELIESLREEDVTLSTVSIGNGVDTPWLADMADLGNGRFHLTDRASNLPEIFTQETTSIQRTYLVEERFFPTLVNASPLIRGISEVPPLFGYVATSPKSAAQVVLETHQGDPLLATWQYGLGRAVAWTSDATGRWGASWVQWNGFPAFWAQTVRWSITEGRNSNVQTTVTYEDEEARLVVDTRDDNGAFLNDLEMVASVVAPDGAARELALSQVAPGQYEASFAPDSAGAYFIRVAGQGDDEAETVVAQTSGWVLGYSPEYQSFAADEETLSRLALETGGANVATDPAAVFSHTLPSEPVRRPIWPFLLLAATLLLPLDIGVRRLVVTRRDWERLMDALFGRFRRGTPAMVTERTEQVARLFQAKQRAGTGTGRSDAPDLAAVDTPEAPASDFPRAQAPSRPAPPPPPTEDAGALASRLLRKKREREDRDSGG